MQSHVIGESQQKSCWHTRRHLHSVSARPALTGYAAAQSRQQNHAIVQCALLAHVRDSPNGRDWPCSSAATAQTGGRVLLLQDVLHKLRMAACEPDSTNMGTLNQALGP